MIPVFMVHGELVSVIPIKLPPAFRTDKTMNFERAFSVVTVRESILFQIANNFIDRFIAFFLPRLRIPSKFAVSHFIILIARSPLTPSLSPTFTEAASRREASGDKSRNESERLSYRPSTTGEGEGLRVKEINAMVLVQYL
jgi:hypothetical protein